MLIINIIMVIQLLYEIPDDPFAPREKPFEKPQRIFPIAYLNASPEETLKSLISEYYVVGYLGLTIPSKSEFTTINEGILIQQTSSEVMGIEGKLDDLKNNVWFEKAKRPIFTQKEKYEVGIHLIESLTHRIKSIHLSDMDIQNYLTIFQNLNYEISPNEIPELIEKQKKEEEEAYDNFQKHEELLIQTYAEEVKKGKINIPLATVQ